MKNLTLSADARLIEEGRRYAADHHTTLNALIRDYLERLVARKDENWVGVCLKEMHAAKGNSKGKKWTREELYRD